MGPRVIASRRAPLRRRLRLHPPKPRTLIAIVTLLVIVGTGYLWLRDSSLVAVQKVRVTGVSGPDSRRIRGALRLAARNMTTLDVQSGQLRTAVRPYPVVKRLDVSTQFPHGMTIHVSEQVPVATVVADGRRTAVSADGTLLANVTSTGSVPTIVLAVPPGGARLNGSALGEVRVLAAAPYRILGRIASMSDGAAHGLTAALRHGPSIYFGSGGALSEKWGAAIRVLGDPGSAGALYIDVSVPARPAAGATAGTSAAPGAPTSTSAAPGAPTSTSAAPGAPTSTNTSPTAGTGTGAAPGAGVASTSG